MDIEKTIKNLKARHFSVQHFASGEEACKYLLGEIKDTSVGIGGSKTVDQLGLYDKLVDNGNEVFWHWREPGLETLDKENAAKVFISSANAIAETGEIINIDGRGNRLAGQVLNPRQRFEQQLRGCFVGFARTTIACEFHNLPRLSYRYRAVLRCPQSRQDAQRARNLGTVVTVDGDVLMREVAGPHGRCRVACAQVGRDHDLWRLETS